MDEHVDGGGDRASDRLARRLGELLGIAEVVELGERLVSGRADR